MVKAASRLLGLILLMTFWSTSPSLAKFQSVDSIVVQATIIQEDSVISFDKQPNLPYQHNSLRFVFNYPNPNRSVAQFQYFLSQFDEGWSRWSNENQKDYTNLPEGKYDLRIRARVEGQTNYSERLVTFSIQAPWYRTWLAYLIYFVSFFGFVLFVVRWRSANLIKEKELLENRVQEATDEIRSQAEKLHLQAEKLKEIDNLKSRFFANISHEFRTPLTLLIGPLERKMESGQDAEDLREARMMLRNSRKLLRLVNQLLDLSKLEAGNMVLEVRQGDIMSFLQILVSSFSSLADLKQIELKSYIPELRQLVYFDPENLEQVIYNLLSNAFKFTPKGGKITIEAKPIYNEATNHNGSGENEEVDIILISVEDNGIGIPGHEVYHLFDRFYQVDSSDTREHEGSGIGLALTKELVELHGGFITVESDNAKGAKFSVSIPVNRKYFKNSQISEKQIARGSNTEVPDEFDIIENDYFQDNVKPDPNAIEFENLKNAPMILIVEDNADVRQFIKENLNLGYSFREASNGLDGLAMAVETIPDLIIADVMMPKMNGIELCNKVKVDERTSHIPVIMLTAKANLETKIEGLETGADDYITKPFNINELKARVNNLLEQRQKLRDRFERQVTLQPRDIVITNKDEAFLDKTIKIIEENISDPDFTVEVFQKQMGMSRMQLHRKLKALTEKSTSEFIRFIRMKRAAQLLEQEAGTVSEIAYEVGFSDPSYFTKCFRVQYGVSPSEFKN